MIPLPANTRIWIAAGVTDLRRGFVGLSALVQTALNPPSETPRQSGCSSKARAFDGSERGSLR